MESPHSSHKTLTRELLSPAKINLFLRILGRRPDGYHDLYSLMQGVTLYDEITLEVGGGDSINVSVEVPSGGGAGGATIPDGEGNIAYRGALEFLKEASIVKSVSIRIKKRIPVGAGLGGGSSNCASVLRGLNELLGAPLEAKVLSEVGARLGSDVPFFLEDGPCIARGRGELLTPVECPRSSFLLINPGFEVSTKWVYDNLALTNYEENNTLSNSDESLQVPNNIEGILYNDLEGVTTIRYPQIGGIKDMLLNYGASGALMSGSGPTVFGLFSNRESASKAFLDIKALLPEGYSIFLVEGL